MFANIAMSHKTSEHDFANQVKALQTRKE
jgi:hypothetical protein